MTQLGLLEYRPPVVAPHASEQSRQLARVEGRIAELVQAFCASRVGQEFHLRDLTEYVAQHVQAVLDSPRRVMSAMAKSGQVDVEVVSSSSSLWRVRAAGASSVHAP